jgi:hypothetical protein
MRTDASFTLMLFTLSVAATTPGCVVGGQNGIMKEMIREITYSFVDASVPPEYHRSYTITLTSETARVVIDSYGDILADKEYEITDEQFSSIKDSLETNNIRRCVLGENSGCTGGTSEGVTYSDEESLMFSETVYHCGGIDSGNLCGDLAAFAESVRSLVPDFEELLRGTEEP